MLAMRNNNILLKIILILVPFMPLVPIAMFGMGVEGKDLSHFLFITFILSFIALPIYLFILFKTHIKKEDKVFWILLLLLIPNVGQVIFWFRHIK
jgi:hypothetical protein